MKDVSGLGAFGIIPYMSEDMLKQMKFANIKTRAGKIAYLTSLGKDAKKPEIKEGIHESRGALKWIAEILKEDQDEK